jgi:hypothetical protein
MAFGIGVAAMSVLALACAGPASAPDTPDNRLKSATVLAMMFEEAGAVDRARDEGADLATEATIPALELELGRTLTDEEKARVSEIMLGVLEDFLTEDDWVVTVAEILAEEFSVAELDSVIEFFKSPVGMRFLEVEGAVSKKIDDRIGDTLDNRFDAFVLRVDEELAMAFEGLAEEGE